MHTCMVSPGTCAWLDSPELAMRIHVLDVALRQRCTFVTFATEGYLALAQWAAGAPVPMIDAAYDVELDITDTIGLGKNATLTVERTGSLTSEHDQTILVVDIEAIEPDGVLVGRLGASLILLELDERRSPRPTRGARLRIRVPSRQLVLTPVGQP